jgi:hypothetical protein
MRMLPLRRGSANVNEGLLMKRSKYYVRVMRPTFQRAILTVEATSDEAAMRSAAARACGSLTGYEARYLS